MILRRRLRTVADDEGGFTLIEILVAALVLAFGSLAVFMTLVAAIHNVQRGQETQVASSVAQREMEKIRVLPYERVAMVTTPATSTQTGNPATRVSGGEFALGRTGTEKVPMAIAGTGICTTEKPCVNNQGASSCVGGSSPGTFTIGGATGSVYCYVTTVKDAACEAATAKICSYKRVVVAVWLTKRGNLASRPAYYELQATIANPSP